MRNWLKASSLLTKSLALFPSLIVFVCNLVSSYTNNSYFAEFCVLAPLIAGIYAITTKTTTYVAFMKKRPNSRFFEDIDNPEQSGVEWTHFVVLIVLFLLLTRTFPICMHCPDTTSEIIAIASYLASYAGILLIVNSLYRVISRFPRRSNA